MCLISIYSRTYTRSAFLHVLEFLDPVFAREKTMKKQTKTLVFSLWNQAFWVCFRENWIYKFGQWRRRKGQLVSDRHTIAADSLNGQCHEIFLVQVFFHESSSPHAPERTLGSFRIFSKIRKDIRMSRCTTGINDTGGKFVAGVSTTPVQWCTLSCEYLRAFSTKFEMALMGYSGAGKILIHDKKTEVENLVTCTVPFKQITS
jgi:hypothetical protein